MPEEDLIRFLEKVAQLQELVASLDGDPDRREQLARCASHNDVVLLAKAWGYEIGRRWGEEPAASARRCRRTGRSLNSSFRRETAGRSRSFVPIGSNHLRDPGLIRMTMSG